MFRANYFGVLKDFKNRDQQMTHLQKITIKHISLYDTFDGQRNASKMNQNAYFEIDGGSYRDFWSLRNIVWVFPRKQK